MQPVSDGHFRPILLYSRSGSTDVTLVTTVGHPMWSRFYFDAVIGNDLHHSGHKGLPMVFQWMRIQQEDRFHGDLGTTAHGSCVHTNTLPIYFSWPRTLKLRVINQNKYEAQMCLDIECTLQHTYQKLTRQNLSLLYTEEDDRNKSTDLLTRRCAEGQPSSQSTAQEGQHKKCDWQTNGKTKEKWPLCISLLARVTHTKNMYIQGFHLTRE